MRAPDFTPSPRAHRLTIRVEASDIDEFNHANNVVWVRWVNEVAISHACAVGLSPDVCMALDAIWVVRRHAIDYVQPAYKGQLLACATWPQLVQGATSVRRTLFECDGRVLVRAETLWALVYASTGKPRRVPVDMMQRYGYEPLPPSRP
jgi:acyl-CoA thioester hydrolase